MHVLKSLRANLIALHSMNGFCSYFKYWLITVYHYCVLCTHNTQGLMFSVPFQELSLKYVTLMSREMFNFAENMKYEDSYSLRK